MERQGYDRNLNLHYVVLLLRLPMPAVIIWEATCATEQGRAAAPEAAALTRHREAEAPLFALPQHTHGVRYILAEHA